MVLDTSSLRGEKGFKRLSCLQAASASEDGRNVALFLPTKRQKPRLEVKEARLKRIQEGAPGMLFGLPHLADEEESDLE